MRTGAHHRVITPRRLFTCVLTALVLATTACGAGNSQDGDSSAVDEEALAAAKQFYSDNTITVAVGFDPGGGMDKHMRLFAKHLAGALDTTVVPANEVGAGGLVMINNLYNSSTQDGSKLGLIIGGGAATVALAGGDQVLYELDKLSYVGNVDREPRVLVVAEDGPYKTLEDLVEAEDLTAAAQGVASSAYADATVVIEALGLDSTIASAFEGSGELELAILAGDADWFTGSLSSTIPLVESGDWRVLLVIGDSSPAPFEDVANASTIEDLYNPDGGMELMAAHVQVLQFGRPLITHPRIPAARLQYLREVFLDIMEDPAVKADAEQQGLTLNYLSGEETEAIAKSILEAPQAYKDMLKAAASG